MYYGPKIIMSTGIELEGFESKERQAIILNIPLAVINAIAAIM